MTIGNGDDYVGSCINIAARLQKLSFLAMAVSRRGITLTEDQGFTVKKVELAGIGKGELVYVKKASFEKLPPKEKKKFLDP